MTIYATNYSSISMSVRNATKYIEVHRNVNLEIGIKRNDKILLCIIMNIFMVFVRFHNEFVVGIKTNSP